MKAIALILLASASLAGAYSIYTDYTKNPRDQEEHSHYQELLADTQARILISEARKAAQTGDWLEYREQILHQLHVTFQDGLDKGAHRAQ